MTEETKPAVKETRKERKERLQSERKAQFDAEQLALKNQHLKSLERRQDDWKTVGPKLTRRTNERKQRRLETARKVAEIGERNRKIALEAAKKSDKAPAKAAKHDAD